MHEVNSITQRRAGVQGDDLAAQEVLWKRKRRLIRAMLEREAGQ